MNQFTQFNNTKFTFDVLWTSWALVMVDNIVVICQLTSWNYRVRSNWFKTTVGTTSLLRDSFLVNVNYINLNTNTQMSMVRLPATNYNTRDDTGHCKKNQFNIYLYTLFDNSTGNDTPMKNPETTPTNVIRISLIFSFLFLRKVLRLKKVMVCMISCMYIRLVAESGGRLTKDALGRIPFHFFQTPIHAPSKNQ